MEVKFNLFTLTKRLELAKGKTIKWSDVADGAGLHRNTVHRMATNDATRIDLETIKKLVAYFTAEGMPISPGDLFTIEG